MKSKLLHIGAVGLAMSFIAGHLSRAEMDPKYLESLKRATWVYFIAVDSKKKLYHVDESDKVSVSVKVLGSVVFENNKNCFDSVLTVRRGSTWYPGPDDKPEKAQGYMCMDGTTFNLGTMVEQSNAPIAIRHFKSFIDALDTFSTRAKYCEYNKIYTTSPDIEGTALRTSMRALAQFPKFFDGGVQEKGGSVSVKGGTLATTGIKEISCSTGGENATCSISVSSHSRTDCSSGGGGGAGSDKSPEKILSTVSSPDFGTGGNKSAPAPAAAPAPKAAAAAPKADSPPPSNNSAPFGGKPFGE